MDFQAFYQNAMSRLGRFRTSEEFEVQKTVASIDALLRRADDLSRGCLPGSRFGCPPGIDMDNLITRAMAHLEALERGERPLRGRFTEPGIALVDHSFIEVDGVMHLFYNRGWIGYDWSERFNDTIGHATTTDLIYWNIHPPVLAVDPQCFDDHQVWSPAVIAHNGRYWMFYTGVNVPIAQAVCLATSDDLFHWTRYSSEPIYTPGPWGHWDASRWSDCRDSFVLADNGRFYQYYCTSRETAAGSMEPANGVIVSDDLIHWEELGTFRMPTCDLAAESPFVIKHDGRYYFFYTNCGHGTSYAISDNPVDGWVEQELLLTPSAPCTFSAHVPSCAEVFCFKGKWYISSCERLPGWEQYLEIHELFWEADGTVRIGNRLE